MGKLEYIPYEEPATPWVVTIKNNNKKALTIEKGESLCHY